MAKQTILITGSTGFLGSHITEAFMDAGYTIIATKRLSSKMNNCYAFKDKVGWINIDDMNWQEQVIEHHPQTIIHTAWFGVGAKQRDDLIEQSKNLEFLASLLSIARDANTKRFIGFGSQAEYGFFSEKVSEDYPINPNSAYGITKYLASELIEKYCTQNRIDWCWLRLFSFFGEKEGSNWFIPTVVKKILSGEKLDMTPGMQRYAYMYVKDLAKTIVNIQQCHGFVNGIYNLSSNTSYTLKEVVEKIIHLLGTQNVNVNFGVFPYRENQPMKIEGNNEKLEKIIGKIVETDFEDNLKATIDYYKENQTHEF
jgi:nucleoside-diphosphate-sugar epimerase